ncbi:hypothetical protein AB0M41_44195 [Streptomyces sp. NPDC051896]|uniref:hypothetical protein n=1 Tax=Streptomyces sp. NPDC051896 TaxID=3155416 RepID=UPI003412D1CD
MTTHTTEHRVIHHGAPRHAETPAAAPPPTIPFRTGPWAARRRVFVWPEGEHPSVATVYRILAEDDAADGTA